MSSCLDRISAHSDGVSVFDRLVAFTIYDGPVTGAAFCKGSNDPVLFRLEAWDDSQAARVFSLAPISAHVGEDLVHTLASVDNPGWPEWWLKTPPTPEAARTISEAISRAVQQAEPVAWVVVSEDLLVGFSMAVKVTEGVARRTFEKLSHRASPDAEVSDGSFAQWVRFIADQSVAR